MKHSKKIDLFNHNTMRLHSIADDYYEPESYGELISLISELRLKNAKYYILGAGSNVLLPNCLHTPIISTGSLNNEIVINDNIVKCGASVRIQNLIRTCQKHSLGGLEYLMSVPCNVGGAIYMNAGAKDTVSTYLQSVETYNIETGKIEIMQKEGCCFGRRCSIFQNDKYVILSATFMLPSMAHDEIELKIQNRFNFSKKYLDAEKPSCGSVFCRSNSTIMRIMKGMKIGNACYSSKKTNWISNLGGATYRDILRLIKIAEIMHTLLFQKYKLEIKIFK